MQGKIGNRISVGYGDVGNYHVGATDVKAFSLLLPVDTKAVALNYKSEYIVDIDGAGEVYVYFDWDGSIVHNICLELCFACDYIRSDK